MGLVFKVSKKKRRNKFDRKKGSGCDKVSWEQVKTYF